MKSQHLFLTTLFTLSSLVSAQSDPFGTGTQSFQFKRSTGQSYNLNISGAEIATLTESGALEVTPAAGGLTGISDTVLADPDSSFLVFYPPGEEGNENKRLILRKKYVVKLKANTDIQQLQNRCNIGSITMMYPEHGLAVCEESSAVQVLEQVKIVAQDPFVESVEPLFARKRFKKAVPTDPFYAAPGREGSYQWGLNNTGDNGGIADVDIRLEEALDITDAGGGPLDGAIPATVVVVVDDGLFYTHPDLMVNVLVDGGINFNDGDPDDPIPLNVSEGHGTSVAGIIGAVGNNDIGITGVAPAVRLLGVRLIAGPVTPEDEAAALNLESARGVGFKVTSNNSWGPSDAETTLEPAPDLVRAAIEAASSLERDRNTGELILNSGTVFVWAAGNGAEIGDNSNYDGYANLPETIAVGAVTDQGTRPLYSERGANLVVSAPSSGGGQGILTTSIEEDAGGALAGTYTDQFGDTSAAAPVVSGVIALMLDANRNLGWRDIQEILMQTARMVDPDNGDWIQNGAGINFNHDFGAGLVDAEAAVQAAKDRTEILPDLSEVPPLERLVIPIAEPGNNSGAVPNGTGDSFITTFDLSDAPNRRVEHVQLRTTIATTRRADLDIVLISPNGTQSILAQAHSNSTEESIVNWNFMTVRNWGEGSQGTWVVRITDRNPGADTAIVSSMSLIVHGPEDENAPVTPAPVLVSDRLIFGTQGTPINYTAETLGAVSIAITDLPPGLTFNAAAGTITGAPTEAGVFVSPVTITGASETRNTTISFLIRPTALSLGEAVGQEERLTTSGGDASWDFEFGEGNVADGTSSVSSPTDLGDNLESRFGFNGFPGGVVLFKWRVSSQPGVDRLWFNLGGGNVPQIWSAFIDGLSRTEFSTVAVKLPNASNRIEWIYSKDENDEDENGEEVDTGSNQGFVDTVEHQPYDQFKRAVDTAGNINFDYEQTSRTLWMPVDDATASEGRALQASGIGHGQTVGLAAWVDGPATLSFDFKIDADTGDGVEYLLNGVVRNALLDVPVVGTGTGNGPTAWMNVTDQLPEGRNYIEIRFRKNFDGESGADTAYLDNLSVVSAENFFSWANDSNLGAGEIAWDADPDGDGYNNREEYAFGGNPLVADKPLYIPTLNTVFGVQWFEFGIDTNKTDLLYEPQESTNLKDWTKIESLQFDRTEGSVEFFRMPVFPNSNEPNRYFRVEVTPKN